jgi:thioredoxin-dependent peroxiredoxin
MGYGRQAVLCAAALLAPVFAARAQSQSGTTSATPAPAAPALGDMAPSFQSTATDSTGRAIPVSLNDVRGKVVVLAFYPLDRSQGCTAELDKFRDEFGSMFGRDVVVWPASVDTLASHASWAREAHFPFAMIADPQGQVARAYGSVTPGRPYFNRTVFVIGRDGRVAYEDLRFGALSEDAYRKLAAAVAAAKGAQ